MENNFHSTAMFSVFSYNNIHVTKFKHDADDQYGFGWIYVSYMALVSSNVSMSINGINATKLY